LIPANLPPDIDKYIRDLHNYLRRLLGRFTPEVTDGVIARIEYGKPLTAFTSGATISLYVCSPDGSLLGTTATCHLTPDKSTVTASFSTSSILRFIRYSDPYAGVDGIILGLVSQGISEHSFLGEVAHTDTLNRPKTEGGLVVSTNDIEGAFLYSYSLFDSTLNSVLLSETTSDLIVTGSPTPDVKGNYNRTGVYNGKVYYRRSDNAYDILWKGLRWKILKTNDPVGGDTSVEFWGSMTNLMASSYAGIIGASGSAMVKPGCNLKWESTTRGSLLSGDTTPKWGEFEVPLVGEVITSSILTADNRETDGLKWTELSSKGSLVVGTLDTGVNYWDELVVVDDAVLVSKAATASGLFWSPGESGKYLKFNGTEFVWDDPTSGLVGTHNILDGGTVHSDANSGSPTLGSIIMGNGTKWDDVGIGTLYQVWQTKSGSTAGYDWLRFVG